MLTSKVNELLEEICQNIGGEWLLTGGSLVQLQLEATRATEDIDIVNLGHPKLSDTLSQNELFKAAIRIGLSPENVNSAASFFVSQVPDWKAHLIKMKEGKIGLIYRPDLTLFIALKLARGTEIDLLDIASAIKGWTPREFDFDAFQKMASKEAVVRFNQLRKKWGL